MRSNQNKTIKRIIMFSTIILFAVFIVYLGINEKIPLPWERYKRTPDNLETMNEEMQYIYNENEHLFNEIAEEFVQMPAYTWCSKGDIPTEIQNNPILIAQVKKVLEELNFEVIATSFDMDEKGKIVVEFRKESGYRYQTGICYNGPRVNSLVEPCPIGEDWYFYFDVGIYGMITFPSE